MKKEFKVWKTIKIGTHKDVEELLDLLGKRDLLEVGRGAKELMKSFAFEVSKEEREVSLVKVSLSDLGLKESRDSFGLTIKEVIKKGKEQGLDLCPAEVGPQLRLQLMDQRIGPWSQPQELVIIMKPIPYHKTLSHIFSLVCEKIPFYMPRMGEHKKTLSVVEGHNVTHTEVWDVQFIFCL